LEDARIAVNFEPKVAGRSLPVGGWDFSPVRSGGIYPSTFFRGSLQGFLQSLSTGLRIMESGAPDVEISVKVEDNGNMMEVDSVAGTDAESDVKQLFEDGGEVPQAGFSEVKATAMDTEGEVEAPPACDAKVEVSQTSGNDADADASASKSAEASGDAAPEAGFKNENPEEEEDEEGDEKMQTEELDVGTVGVTKAEGDAYLAAKGTIEKKKKISAEAELIEHFEAVIKQQNNELKRLTYVYRWVSGIDPMTGRLYQKKDFRDEVEALEDVADNDFDEKQYPSAIRGLKFKRTKLKMLEILFKTNPKREPGELITVAEKLDLDINKVQFNNRCSELILSRLRSLFLTFSFYADDGILQCFQQTCEEGP